MVLKLHLPLIVCVTAALLATATISVPAVSAKKRPPVEIGTRRAATALLIGTFPKRWTEKAGGSTPPKFLTWPIPGRPIGRGYGSNNGKHLAVDITAPEGTAVRAAAQGIVGYADNGVKGYGNLMMVVHPGGWVTLYAHLSGFKARAGQRISRGQTIALTGNTGISKGPHLHTALLINGKPVDPIPYMRDVPKRRVARLFHFGSTL